VSDKRTCIGCNSHTSAIYRAFEDDKPCPYCGLLAEVTARVEEARRVGAESGLIKRYQEAEVRASKAEAELLLLRQHLAQIEEAVRRKPDPSPW
jgi:hypothetical protein